MPNLLQRLLLIAALGAGVTPALFAQVSPEEHAKHHPQGGAADQGPSNAGGGMMGGGQGGMAGGGMEGMMSSMGVPPPKELYPSLMDLPDLPLEARAEVRQQAHMRMMEGASLLATAIESLSRAAPGDDFRAMQDALDEAREGLARFESGLAAHRALVEGSAPRNVALQWFKREMDLLPLAGEDRSGAWFWGMTPFHAFTMVVLVLFSAAMLVMYFFKMRRATALLQALASAKPASAVEKAKNPAKPSSPPDSSKSSSPPASSESSVAASPEAQSQSSDGAEDGCCDTQEGACASDAGIASGPDASKGLLPVHRRKLCRLRVARIDQETPDVKTFRFVACHGGGIPFSYLPGQFLTLTLPVGEKAIRRSYTISSSPTQGYYCEISVKREEHGAGSRYLHDQVSVGDTFEVQAPNGKFVFTGQEADGIVLIAGGVGITPMMSIARALTDMAWEGEIYFIVACSDLEHFIFESELRRLQERHQNLHVFAALSQLDHDVDGYRKGRLTREYLDEWVSDVSSMRVHLCGPPPFMDAVKQMLAELEVPAESVHTESFGSRQKPRVRAAEATSQPDAGSAEASQPEADSAATGAVLTFSKSGESTSLQPDETILEAAERVGVEIEYSCRVGSCGVCAVKLLSGEVSMEVEDGLEPEDKQAGMVLACQAKSTGEVSVEA